MDDTVKPSLTVEVLKHLPFGKFCGFEKTRGMDGGLVMAVVWAFWDAHDYSRIRKAFFSIEDGTYIGEKDL
jgi:hypothetical protein